MTPSSFDNLLERYLKGECSPTECHGVERWLGTMRRNGIPEFVTSLDKERLLTMINKPDTHYQQRIGSFNDSQRRNTSHYRLHSIRLLFVMALFCAFMTSRWYSLTRHQTLQTQSGGQAYKRIPLEDGSIAWLKEISSLIYFMKDDERYAFFSGEGFFEISDKSLQPFHVICGSKEIVTQGSDFYLSAITAGIEIKVRSGRISLFRDGKDIGAEAARFDKVTLTKDHLARARMGLSELNSMPFPNSPK